MPEYYIGRNDKELDSTFPKDSFENWSRFNDFSIFEWLEYWTGKNFSCILHVEVETKNKIKSDANNKTDARV